MQNGRRGKKRGFQGAGGGGRRGRKEGNEGARGFLKGAGRKRRKAGRLEDLGKEEMGRQDGGKGGTCRRKREGVGRRRLNEGE